MGRAANADHRAGPTVQDTLPRTAERFARAAEDQRANRAFLAARGLP
jgi:hypothetical protein